MLKCLLRKRFVIGYQYTGFCGIYDDTIKFSSVVHWVTSFKSQKELKIWIRYNSHPIYALYDRKTKTTCRGENGIKIYFEDLKVKK